MAALNQLVFQNVERLLENVGIKVRDLGVGRLVGYGPGHGTVLTGCAPDPSGLCPEGDHGQLE